MFFPFGEDFLRTETALGEDGAVGLGLFHGVLPVGVERGKLRGIEIVEVEFGLIVGGAVFLEQSRLDEGEVDALGIGRERDEDAEFLADGFGFSQDDIEDESIDGIVLAVEHGGADFLGLLAEAVHAAFPLLVAGGIPREVVVDDGGEEVLEIDAFG